MAGAQSNRADPPRMLRAERFAITRFKKGRQTLESTKSKIIAKPVGPHKRPAGQSPRPHYWSGWCRAGRRGSYLSLSRRWVAWPSPDTANSLRRSPPEAQ
jgi:hypothetical protein